MDASNYVHQYVGTDGQMRYVVAEKCGAGDYYAECSRSVVRQTGWSCVLGSLSCIVPDTYQYASRAAALRRARQLYQ